MRRRGTRKKTSGGDFPTGYIAAKSIIKELGSSQSYINKNFKFPATATTGIKAKFKDVSLSNNSQWGTLVGYAFAQLYVPSPYQYDTDRLSYTISGVAYRWYGGDFSVGTTTVSINYQNDGCVKADELEICGIDTSAVSSSQFNIFCYKNNVYYGLSLALSLIEFEITQGSEVVAYYKACIDPLGVALFYDIMNTDLTSEGIADASIYSNYPGQPFTAEL